MDDRKATVNACVCLIRRRAKIKALHRVDARQKKNPAGLRRGLVFIKKELFGIIKPPEAKIGSRCIAVMCI